MDFSYAIALSGGIATGKSTLALMLRQDGFSVIDLDKISHEILNSHAKDIGSIFGCEYIYNDMVDKNKLANLIFNDAEKKQKLEEFMHPKILSESKKQAKKLSVLKKPYFLEIPLFFETNSYDIQKCVLVYANKKNQLKRLMKRSNLDKQEALKRINSQMDIEKKRQMADFIIDNNLDLKHLKTQILNLKKWLKETYAVK